MAKKAMVLLFACMFLVTARVSSFEADLVVAMHPPVMAPAHAPAKHQPWAPEKAPIYPPTKHVAPTSPVVPKRGCAQLCLDYCEPIDTSKKRVLSNDEEFLSEVSSPSHSPVEALAPAKVPAKAPSPIPHVKPPVLPPSPAKKPPTKTQIDCTPLCVERCKLHSRKQVCLRACMTCCDRCKCVPPGTYGNHEKCGKCYTDMTTTGGRPKCP
ncbi:hypothetical protein Vadar_002951 [Vaccinium darrowii]|uniref:Uncharacterized protein n=1 Tax=Vaccinium darrowii TaxID=229202 RepID=A0ACB7XW85_9ERIC|nr:hypothetical protein Vadar_002951 [Vaccinium darrowii]